MTQDASRSIPTRRDAVSLMGAAAAAAFVPASRAFAGSGGTMATGVVFEDRSGAGRRRPGDPGVADVLVSNGQEVVRTDAQGRYSLPIADEGLIFVVKPPGWAVRGDDNNLPRFTYLHQPDGTPEALNLRFPGVEPTGPLPASIDFALTRADEPAAFDVILFTDPQPESAEELSFVRDTAFAHILGTKAAFGITTGDIMFDDLSLYPRYNRLIGQVGIPWWHVGGNHDLNYEAPDAARSRETFKRVYGAPYYAFHYGQALFLMLDNVNYLGASPTAPGVGGEYEGRFSERQLTFVANVLRETPRDRLVVLAMHIPLATETDRGTANADALLAMLEDRPVLSVAGHTHTTEHHYLGTGGAHHHHVLTAVSGSWWSGPFDRSGIACADSQDGTPNGYHVLSIDGARYTTRFVPLSCSEKRAMRVSLESRFHGRKREVARDLSIEELLGSPIQAEALASTNLVVNVFDGGPKTRVACRIAGRAPFELKRIGRTDPFVEQVYARHAATKKPWVEPVRSTHIWTARLPPDLPPGTHRADIAVTDEYGRENRDSLIVEVLAGSVRHLSSRT